MADRNMTTFRQYSRFTTREGMELYVPPSDFFDMEMIPRVVDPFLTSSEQRFPLGTQLTYAERVFRYSKNGAVALATGVLHQSVVPLAGMIDEAVDTPAVGDVTITITLAASPTDDLAINDLADGYINIVDDTGEGHLYRIKSHPAIAGAVAGVLTLYDPILVALGAGATITVMHNSWRNVIIHPSPPTAPVVGASVVAVPANEFCWLQTEGLSSVLTDGVVVIGEAVVASDADNGAVEAADAAITDGTPPTGHGERILGYVKVVGPDTEHSIIWLDLE